MNAPCTVFLDFDGVVHPEPCTALEGFRQLPVIESVLRGFPEVQIVISSSWREHETLAQLRGHFHEDMAARVVDVTPVIAAPSWAWGDSPGATGLRQEECLQWLKAHRHSDSLWLAIDDRPEFFQPGCRQLLLTDWRTGFSLSDALRLRVMLRKLLNCPE